MESETVPRLFRKFRSKGVYKTTLEVIQCAHEYREATGARPLVPEATTGVMTPKASPVPLLRAGMLMPEASP